MPITIAPSPATLKRYGAKLTKTSLALDTTTLALAPLTFLFGLANAIQKSDDYTGPVPHTNTSQPGIQYTSSAYGTVTAAQSTCAYIFLNITAPVCTIAFSLSNIYTACADGSRGLKPGRSVAVSVLLVAIWTFTLFWGWGWATAAFWNWGPTRVGVDVEPAVRFVYFAFGVFCGGVEVARMAVHARLCDLERKGRKGLVRVESPIVLEMVGEGEEEGVGDGVVIKMDGGKSEAEEV